MIYLILDTNIWLYLANGLDPLTEKHHDDLHFKLLAGLKELKDNNDICILINDIVFEEWKRNKENAKLKIKKLTNKLSNPDSSFNDLKKYVKSETEGLKREYIEGLKKDIAKNEEHIQKVEDFIFNDCERVEISQELKIKIFDLSVLNKAPFHNKKNNIADASIMLSAAEYLKGKNLEEDRSAIFVSNNVDDFTDGKNKDDFHPEIKEIIADIEIKYERVLPSALKVSREIIQQIEEYRKHEIWLGSVSFSCRTPYCEGNKDFSPWGYLDEKIRIKYETDEEINPNQTTLFEDLPSIKKEPRTVGIGECMVCGTLHVECPECGELTYVDDQTEEFECTECSTKFEIKYDKKEDAMCLFVNDIQDDEHE